MTAKRRLGRGLEGFVGGSRAEAAGPAANSGSRTDVLDVAVDALAAGRYQPRQRMSEQALAELADSIRARGLLQPLVVRPVPDAPPDAAGRYEIVAGERRWRAARMAGLRTVPVIVRDLDDPSALAVALIENLQREDLDPLEQAESMARLTEEFGLTHQQVAESVGRSRSSVSNLLRLLDLHDDAKALLVAGRIDMGHARALLTLEPERQAALAHKAAARGWSVRQTERASRAPPAAKPRGGEPIDPQAEWLQRQIAAELGPGVVLRPRGDGTFSFEIAFGDLERLHDVLARATELIARIRTTAGPRARDAGH